MLRHLAAGLFSLAVLATAPDAALAERRVALVIGNSAYQNTAPLKNPATMRPTWPQSSESSASR